MTSSPALLSTFCLSLKCNEKHTECSSTFTKEEVPQICMIIRHCHRSNTELKWQQLLALRKANAGTEGYVPSIPSLSSSPRP